MDDRYKDIHSMQKQQKIDLLKEKNINPLNLEDGYDSVASALHKWTTIAHDAKNAKLSGEAYERLAKNYYDKMLVPAYGKLGTDAPSLELWQREAYKEDGAYDYDINDAYMNPVMRGITHALASTIQDVENVVETGTNLLGYGLKEGWAKAPLAAKAIAKGAVFEPESWVDKSREAMNGTNPGFWETAKRETRTLPVLGAISKVFDDRALQWWNESIPQKGFVDHATSFGVELAAAAPLFEGIALANEAGIAYTGLNEALGATKIGNAALHAITAFGEGLIYGTATRPQEDKSKAMEDGLTFMALSGVFAGLGKLATPWVERFKKSGGLDVLGDKAKEYSDRWTTKRRPLNSAEKDKMTEAATANMQAVAHNVGTEAAHEQGIALAYDWASKGLNEKQIQSDIRKRMKAAGTNSAEIGKVIEAARTAQRFSGKRSIIDIVDNADSLKKLRGQFSALRKDAEQNMVQHVEPVQEAIEKDALKSAKEPGAEKAKQRIRERIIASHPNIEQALARGQVTKEQIEKQVEEEYAKKVRAAAVMNSKKAEKIRNASKDAETVGKKRTAINADRDAKAKAKAEHLTKGRGPQGEIEPAESVVSHESRRAADRAKIKSSGVKAVIAGAGAKGLKSEVSRKTLTEAEETRGAFGGGVTSGLIHRRTIDAHWKNFAGALQKEFRGAKAGGYSKNFEAFIKDHVTGMEEHDFSEFLHYFLPPEMGPFERDIFFEKGKAGENPNLMAFMLNYKPMLPKSINTEISNRLRETVKVNLALPKNQPVTNKDLQFYARIMYNHVDNLLGSENVRLLGQRNVFKSSAKKMREQTEWMAESIQDRYMQDWEDIQTMFQAHPEQMNLAKGTLDSIYQGLYNLNKEVFDGSIDPKKAEKWKKASDDLSDWLVGLSNSAESQHRLDKWNIDYERAETYKWAAE